MINYATDLSPFFQVVINRVDKLFDLKLFSSAIKAALDEKNNTAENDFIQILDKKETGDNLIIHFGHKSIPTWFISKTGVDQTKPVNKIEGVENFENDLAIIYHKKDYLFIYCNCGKIETIIAEAIANLNANSGWMFLKLSLQTINHILHHLELQFRTLGLSNIFNAGGSAPEAKAYFGRNTVYSLTPSFDAGYGFSYCLGAIVDKKAQRKPFGCSTTKSKIWKTWVDDIKLFLANCDEIIRWIETPAKSKPSNLDILVNPVSKDKLDKAKVIEFYMDYHVHEKGMVYLKANDIESFDWCCYLSTRAKDIIVFEVNGTSSSALVEIRFSYNKTTEKFDFVMVDPKAVLNIQFSNDEGKLSVIRNIMIYLTKQENFTLIFDNGYAYRNGECYRDNRLLQSFNKLSYDIKWDDVDITKEDKPSADPKKKYNILDKVTDHLNGFTPLVCINDNGANEIADCLFIGNDRIVLVHAKFSSKSTSGLRVGDLQVVVSQAIKNLRFFGPSPYTDEIFDRLFKKCRNKKSFKDINDFKERIMQKLNDYRIKRECWIVQPGLSGAKLAGRKKDKIHSLLNFTDSVFSMNQVDFKLYCSSN